LAAFFSAGVFSGAFLVCFQVCDYFFFAAAAFAFVACCDVINACFLEFESSSFDCFCDACFCTDFGDLSPMVGVLSVGFPHRRNVRFPDGVACYPLNTRI
jgi:hypothetical protein